MGIRQIIVLIGVFCLVGGFWREGIALFVIAIVATGIKRLSS